MAENKNDVQKRSEDVGFWDRFALKNLSDNPEEQARYLADMYKDKLVVGLKNVQVVTKKPNAKEWQYLDPEGFDIEDISDIAGDLLTGGVTGAITTGAGLMGGAATGGVGALPAAMAAGGVSSGAAEAIKQKLAQMYGIKKSDLNMGDIALQGGIGMAGPAAFGIGASAKQVAKYAKPDSAAKKLIQYFTDEAVEGPLSAAQKETAKEALASSGEGLLTKLGRKGVSWLSGSDEEGIRTARKMLPAVQALEKKGATKEFLQSVAEKARSSFTNKIDEVGERINNVVDASGVGFDVDTYKAPFLAEIDRLGKSTRSEDRELADKIFEEMQNVFAKDVYDDFGRVVGSEPMTTASAHEMQAIKQSLLDLSQGRRLPTGRSAVAGQDYAPARLKSVAAEAGSLASDDFDKKVVKAAEKIGDRNVLGEYKKIRQLQNELGPKLKNAEVAGRTLNSATGKNKRQLFETMEEADKILGTDLAPSAKTLEAFRTWNKPSWSAISSRGSTSTSKTGTSGIAGAGAMDIAAKATDAPGWAQNFLRAAGALGLTTAVSPAAQRMYFETTQPLMNAMSKIPNQHAIGQSAWQLMQGAE